METNTAITRRIKEGEVECELEDLLFPVEIRDEEMPSNSEYSCRVVGQLDGGDFLLNQCSPRYELVPNAEIFPIIRDTLIGHRIPFNVRYTHIDRVRFYADYTFNTNSFKVNNANDEIFPMLRVQHSYNGLTKYRIIFGYFRLVCTNGLTIPVKEMKEFNLVIIGKHTESIKKSFLLLGDKLDFFAMNYKLINTAMKNRYEILGGHMVAKPEDRIKEVLLATKIGILDNKNFDTVNNILGTVEKEAKMYYGGQVNDWLIYNGINQYIFDGRTIAAPEKKMETDSKVLEHMLAF
jgi:hypothetical protein